MSRLGCLLEYCEVLLIRYFKISINGNWSLLHYFNGIVIMENITTPPVPPIIGSFSKSVGRFDIFALKTRNKACWCYGLIPVVSLPIEPKRKWVTVKTNQACDVKKDFIPEVRYGHIALEVLDFSSSRRNRFGYWWNLVLEQYLVLNATSMLLVSRRIVFAC